MSSIFGGGKSVSSSQNQAYGTLSKDFAPTISTGTGATNQIANMLGLNGAQGQNQAFQNWQNSTGYQFGLNQGMQSINGNAAAQGLLNSGATAKALNTYGQNYANTQYGNYMNQLTGLAGQGLQAGGLLAGAGQTSSSKDNRGSNAGAISNVGNVFGSFLGK